MMTEFFTQLIAAKKMEMEAFKALIPDTLRPHTDAIETELLAIAKLILSPKVTTSSDSDQKATAPRKIKIT